MNRKTITAIKESIAHWRRMIAWVDKQNPLDRASLDGMLSDLGESWLGEYCPLCKLFFALDNNCINCPLAKEFGQCDDETARNAWKKVNTSSTWKSWLLNAKEMLRQLESLLEEKDAK